MTQAAFDIADRYRNPVLVLGDGMIGQMMEPVDMDKKRLDTPRYRPGGKKPGRRTAMCPRPDRPRSIINSLYIDPKVLERHCLRLESKYKKIAENECRWQEEMLDDAEIVVVAYGTTSRIVRSAIRKCRAEGLSLWGCCGPLHFGPSPPKPSGKPCTPPSTI